MRKQQKKKAKKVSLLHIREEGREKGWSSSEKEDRTARTCDSERRGL
jgi:hypothetical protein